MNSLHSSISLIDVLPSAVFIAVDGVLVDANPAALRLLEAEELSQLQGQKVADLVHTLDQTRSQVRIQKDGGSWENPAAKMRIRTLKNHFRILLVASRSIQYQQQDAVLISALDMTEHDEMDAHLRQSELDFRRLFENMQDVYYRTDAAGYIRKISPSVLNMLGYEPEEVEGKDAKSFYLDAEESESYRQAILSRGRVTDFPGKMRCKSGRVIDISLNSQALCDEQGNFAGIEGVFRDVTQRNAMELELKRLTTTDALTNIENRRAFLEHTEHVFKSAQRYNTRVSLLMLDLDLFKTINDAHGHLVGDQVLVRFAEAVKIELREIDLFGRLGGEEFCVLLQQTTDQQAMIVAERIRKRVEELRFFDNDGAQFGVTVSLGIASNHPQDQQLERLLERADKALYQAKHSGRNQSRVEILPA